MKPASFVVLLSVVALGACSSSESSSSGSGGSSSTSGSGGSSSTSGSGGSSSTSGSGGSSSSGGGGGSVGIASKYPGDVGIETDPAVVWAENFEEGSVSAVTARYDDSKNQGGMSLDADVPAPSSGAASMRMVAGGGGPTATDLFKSFGSGYPELFVRYYAKYQDGIEWHHTGVWLGGYHPPTNWPNPQAGLKPNGDDRFSISIEPMEPGTNPRLDFYNYWMTMHSWMDNPSGNTAYYGNSLVHQSGFQVTHDWMCVEIHAKVNPDPAAPAGAELGVWLEDAAVVQFTDQAPLGYWIKDKFCPEQADSPECTNYPPGPNTQMIPLDLQLRNVAALELNHFWPQNYITSGPAGSVWYDDMVVATARVGCIQ